MGSPVKYGELQQLLLKGSQLEAIARLRNAQNVPSEIRDAIRAISKADQILYDVCRRNNDDCLIPGTSGDLETPPTT